MLKIESNGEKMVVSGSGSLIDVTKDLLMAIRSVYEGLPKEQRDLFATILNHAFEDGVVFEDHDDE